MSDIVSNLWGRWSCNDAADGVIEDSSGNGFDLTVTANGGGFPKRVGRDRQFDDSAPDEHGYGPTPDNYASRALTANEYRDAVGLGNAHGGDCTFAAWYKRGDHVPGSGTLITLGGVALSTDSDADKGIGGSLFHNTDTGYDHIRFTDEANTQTFTLAPPSDWVHLAVVQHM